MSYCRSFPRPAGCVCGVLSCQRASHSLYTATMWGANNVLRAALIGASDRRECVTVTTPSSRELHQQVNGNRVGARMTHPRRVIQQTARKRDKLIWNRCQTGYFLKSFTSDLYICVECLCDPVKKTRHFELQDPRIEYSTHKLDANADARYLSKNIRHQFGRLENLIPHKKRLEHMFDMINGKNT